MTLSLGVEVFAGGVKVLRGRKDERSRSYDQTKLTFPHSHLWCPQSVCLRLVLTFKAAIFGAKGLCGGEGSNLFCGGGWREGLMSVLSLLWV